MKTTSIIEGLTILEKYRDKEGGRNCGINFDMIYAHPTDQPLLRGDLERMLELGWVQCDAVCCKGGSPNLKYAAKHYEIKQYWKCYV